jgi:hypothetical protein
MCKQREGPQSRPFLLVNRYSDCHPRLDRGSIFYQYGASKRVTETVFRAQANSHCLTDKSGGGGQVDWVPDQVGDDSEIAQLPETSTRSLLGRQPSAAIWPPSIAPCRSCAPKSPIHCRTSRKSATDGHWLRGSRATQSQEIPVLRAYPLRQHGLR